MKNKKRVLSFVLAAAMMGSTAASAAPFTIVDNATGIATEFSVVEAIENLSELKQLIVKHGVSNFYVDPNDDGMAVTLLEFLNAPKGTKLTEFDAEHATHDLSKIVNPVEEELEVVDVSAINNTTVIVNFNKPIEGTVSASDFTFDNGLAVINAVKGISGEAVTLTTSAQTEGTTYTLTYKGEATNKSFVGKKAEQTNVFDVKSAVARSNTEVTVVLTDAPLRNLTVSDFIITPSLTITSVTTNNNVITLKTAPQAVGTVYTVAAITGTGSATFEGIAAIDNSGVIEKIELLNLRQIKVSFNKPIYWSYASQKDKYYLGLVDEKKGDIATNRLDTIDATSNWAISPADQDIYRPNGTVDPEATVDYVIIESRNGALITDTKANGGLEIAYNKTVTLEARNLDHKVGVNYINTSQGTFTVVDNDAPTVERVTENAEVNKLYKKVYHPTLNPTPTYLANLANSGYIIAKDKAYLEVKFSEPVTDTTDDNGVTGERLDTVNTNLSNPDFKIYIDGIEVKHTATPSMKATIVDPGAASNDGEVVEFDALVENQKTLLIDVTELSRGTHTLKIVGAEDLKGNVMSPNPYQTTFRVSDEVKTPPVQVAKPEVVEIKQIADNALEIYFDQKDVVIADALGKAPVIIEKAEWDITNSVWVDIEAEPNDDLLIKDLSNDILGNPGNPGNIGIYATTYGTGSNTKTKWIVLFNADNDKTVVKAGTTVNYDGQKIISRNIVVQNFQVSGNTHDYYVGDVHRETVQLRKDTIAPEAIKAYANVADGKLYVSFEDAPFDGEIDFTGTTVKVSMTNKDGQTFTEYYTAGVSLTANIDLDADGKVDILANKGIVIDLASNDGTTNPSTLVNSDGELFREAVYTIELPQGSIVDVEEDLGSDDPDLIMVDTNNPNEMKETKLSVITPKDEESAVEGLVPQTTKGLIQSGYEIASNLASNPTAITAITETGDVATVGTIAYMSDPNNQNKIIVVFDGEVLESSALNKNNYTFNGSRLPQGADIEFFIDEVNTNTEIGNGEAKDAFVIITLPEGSVDKDGLYTIKVEGITNKAGKRMLPVEDSVALVDNTRPSATAIKAIGSKQIEITFDELVDITDADRATGNFEVTVDGVKLAVVSVTQQDDLNKVILTTAQDFDNEGSLDVAIKVVIKEDGNGNLYIYDQAVTPNKVNTAIKTN